MKFNKVTTCNQIKCLTLSIALLPKEFVLISRQRIYKKVQPSCHDNPSVTYRIETLPKEPDPCCVAAFTKGKTLVVVVFVVRERDDKVVNYIIPLFRTYSEKDHQSTGKTME